MKRPFSKEDIQMENEHIKKMSTSLATGEMQMETPMRYHYTLIRMAKIQTCENTKCGKNAEKLDLSYIWCKCKMGQLLWKRAWQFLKKLNMLSTIQPSTSPRHLSQRNENLCPHKDLYIIVQSSFVNSPTLETTQIS